MAIFLIFFIIFIIFIFFKHTYAYVFKLKNHIIPITLFFICIEILKKTKLIQIVGNALNNIMYPLFNVPGAGAFALFMGIASGYPTRSKSI